jgi:ATP-dependent Lon protease
MSNTTTIRVNFGRPMPVFPLHVAVLMPHGIAPLEIFEPRYRQMVSDTLDGAGLIAMAMFEGERWKAEYHGRPPIRPAVCVGHISEHFKYPDGRYAIIMQGVCRGRIVEEMPPREDKLYREAMIEPVGVEEEADSSLETYRTHLTSSLEASPLKDLRIAGDAVRHLTNPEIPTAAVIEFLGANLPDGTTDVEARYQWLAAGDVGERAQIVSKRLSGLETLLKKAAPQRAVETPKGCNWN